MDVLRDPIWQFIGVVVSFIALLLTAIPLFHRAPAQSQTPVQSHWIFPSFLTKRKFLITALTIETIVLIASLLMGFVTAFQQNSSTERTQELKTIISRPPDLEDQLSDNANGYQWDDNKTCTFQGGSYHLISSSSAGEGCLSNALTLRNFVFTAKMKIVKGNEGALIFRFSGETHNTSSFYYFYIKIDNGGYGLIKYTPKGQTLASTNLYDFRSQDIKTGLFQINELTVLAKDGTIDLFINQQYAYQISDQQFLPEGTLGFGDGPAGEVIFSQAKVWRL